MSEVEHNRSNVSAKFEMPNLDRGVRFHTMCLKIAIPALLDRTMSTHTSHVATPMYVLRHY
jgi:hypothetical protein